MKAAGTVIVVKRNGQDAKGFPVTQNKCLFGQHPECEIRIRIPSVEEVHCQINVDTSGKAYLTNASSTNPTVVNDVKLGMEEAIILDHKATIQVGGRQFRWEYPKGPLRAGKRKSSDMGFITPSAKRKSVSFGPYLSPEHFDKKLPPSTPVKIGEAVPMELELRGKGLLRRKSPTPIKPELAKALGLSVNGTPKSKISTPMKASELRKQGKTPNKTWAQTLQRGLMVKGVPEPVKELKNKVLVSKKKKLASEPKDDIAYERDFGIGTTGHINSPAPIIIRRKLKETPKIFKKGRKSRGTKLSVAGRHSLDLAGINLLMTSPPTGNIKSEVLEMDQTHKIPTSPFQRKSLSPKVSTHRKSTSPMVKTQRKSLSSKRTTQKSTSPKSDSEVQGIPMSPKQAKNPLLKASASVKKSPSYKTKSVSRRTSMSPKAATSRKSTSPKINTKGQMSPHAQTPSRKEFVPPRKSNSPKIKSLAGKTSMSPKALTPRNPYSPKVNTSILSETKSIKSVSRKSSSPGISIQNKQKMSSPQVAKKADGIDYTRAQSARKPVTFKCKRSSMRKSLPAINAMTENAPLKLQMNNGRCSVDNQLSGASPKRKSLDSITSEIQLDLPAGSILDSPANGRKSRLSMSSNKSNDTSFGAEESENFSECPTMNITEDNFVSPLGTPGTQKASRDKVLAMIVTSCNEVMNISVDADATTFDFNAMQTPNLSKDMLVSPLSTNETLNQIRKTFNKGVLDFQANAGRRARSNIDATTSRAASTPLESRHRNSCIAKLHTPNHRKKKQFVSKENAAPCNSETTTPDFRGMKRLMKTSKGSTCDYTNVTGLKKLLKTPNSNNRSPKADYRNVKGVRKLMETPKARQSPRCDYRNVDGIKQILITPKLPYKADYTDVTGMRRLLRSPQVTKTPDFTKVEGIKRLFESSKAAPAADYSNVEGVKELLKNDSTVSADYVNVSGIRKLMATPRKISSPVADYTDVIGLRTLMKSPKSRPSMDLSEITNLFQSPTLVEFLLAEEQNVSNNIRPARRARQPRVTCDVPLDSPRTLRSRKGAGKSTEDRVEESAPVGQESPNVTKKTRHTKKVHFSEASPQKTLRGRKRKQKVPDPTEIVEPVKKRKNTRKEAQPVDHVDQSTSSENLDDTCILKGRKPRKMIKREPATNSSDSMKAPAVVRGGRKGAKNKPQETGTTHVQQSREAIIDDKLEASVSSTVRTRERRQASKIPKVPVEETKDVKQKGKKRGKLESSPVITATLVSPKRTRGKATRRVPESAVNESRDADQKKTGESSAEPRVTRSLRPRK